MPSGAGTTATATKTTVMPAPISTAEVTTTMQPGAPAATGCMPNTHEPTALRAKRKPVTLPFWWRLERYLSVMSLLIGVGMFVANYFESVWLIPFLLVLISSGILMVSFGVIDYFDKEYLDVAILIIVSGIVGPIYGTVACVLFGLARKKVNYSLLRLMASYFLILLTVGSAAGGFMNTLDWILVPRLPNHLSSFLVQIGPLTLLLVSWIFARDVPFA